MVSKIIDAQSQNASAGFALKVVSRPRPVKDRRRVGYTYKDIP